jgi:6-phosphogluconolactonase
MTVTKKRTVIVKDPHQLAVFGADILKRNALDAVKHCGKFSVAISGGSNPRPMNRLLARKPYRHIIPWKATHLFWVDERLVPLTDPDSNYGNAKTDFLDQLDIPQENIHPMGLEKEPTAAAKSYQQRLMNFFNPSIGQYPIFDFIILGIGSDGHTASIFPDDQAAVNTKKWVCAVKGGNPDVDRLTLTLPLINQAKCIAVLASGQKKSKIIETIFTDMDADLPIQKIMPTHGRLVWLLDQAAAARLPQNIKTAAERV